MLSKNIYIYIYRERERERERERKYIPLVSKALFSLNYWKKMSQVTFKYNENTKQYILLKNTCNSQRDKYL